MDLEYIVKITLQHKHTYGFCYLLGYIDRAPKSHPQALGRYVCPSMPSLGDRGKKENYRGGVQVVEAGVGVRASGTGLHEVTPGASLVPMTSLKTVAL